MAGLKFRVLLDSEQKNEVFRDILINDTDNFETLYHSIIKAFTFEGNQMASFYVSNDTWDKGHEISLMDMTYDDDSIDEAPSTMKGAVIKDFIEEPDQKFILVYDFMRMWIFLVELIGYEKEGPNEPQIILSVGIAPPEDSKMEHEGMMPIDHHSMEMEDFDSDEDDDLYGFNDYEDGFSDEDYSNYDEYN